MALIYQSLFFSSCYCEDIQRFQKSNGKNNAEFNLGSDTDHFIYRVCVTNRGRTSEGLHRKSDDQIRSDAKAPLRCTAMMRKNTNSHGKEREKASPCI